MTSLQQGVYTIGFVLHVVIYRSLRMVIMLFEAHTPQE